MRKRVAFDAPPAEVEEALRDDPEVPHLNIVRGRRLATVFPDYAAYNVKRLHVSIVYRERRLEGWVFSIDINAFSFDGKRTCVVAALYRQGYAEVLRVALETLNSPSTWRPHEEWGLQDFPEHLPRP